MCARTTYLWLMAGLISLTVLASTTASATSPRLHESVRINLIELIGDPVAGATVQLKVIYTSQVNAEAVLVLSFSGPIRPPDAQPGESQRQEPITLVAEQTVQRTFRLTVTESGASHISVGITLVEPVVGYTNGNARYLNIESTEETFQIFDDLGTYPAAIKEITPHSGEDNPFPTGVTTLYTISISGRVEFDDPHQFLRRGLYQNTVQLWFRNSANPNIWYHPVYEPGCYGTRHTHYDILDVNGNYSFNFTFIGDLSAYNQALVIVSRSNPGSYMEVQQNGIIMWCNNSFSVWFSLSESFIGNINGSDPNIVLTNANALVNGQDGAIFRNMMLSREFVVQRYGGSLPFSLPTILVRRLDLPPGIAGQFVSSGSGPTPRIEIDHFWTDAATTSHEFGHFVNYKMWNDYINADNGCTNEIGQTTPGTGRIYREGWAIFYSFCMRNYANNRYGDHLRSYDDNTELGPFQTPRFINIRYTQVDPNISAFACYLWNLYDGYSQGGFESAVYNGDNDDISGQSVRTFEQFRSPIDDCPQRYHLRFRAGSPVELRASIDEVWTFITQTPSTAMRSAQLASASVQAISHQELRFYWMTQEYPSSYLERNYPTGYKVYKNISGNWQVVATATHGTNNVSYTSASPTGNYRITSYNSSGDSYGALPIDVGQIYSVTLTAPTFVEPGSGGSYIVNGTNVGTSWSGVYLEGSPPIILEAVPPTGGWVFTGWSDGNRDNPRSYSPTGNVTLSANYKAHLASNSTAALALSSQRKILRDNYGTYHMVYASAGHIWYTYSTDGGLTWQPEQQVSDDAPGVNRYPTLTFQYMPTFGVVVVWETYYRDDMDNFRVRARTIGQGGITVLVHVFDFDLSEAFSTMPVVSVSNAQNPHYPDHVLVVWKTQYQDFEASIKSGETGNWSRIFSLFSPEAPVSAMSLVPNPRQREDRIIDFAWATESTIKYTTIALNTLPPQLGTPETITTEGGGISGLSLVNAGVEKQPAVAWTDNAFPNSVFFSLRSADGTRWERAASFSHCDHLATSPSLGEYYHSGTNTYFADLVWQCGDHLARVSRTLDRPMWTPIVNLGAGSTPIISAAVRTGSPTMAGWLSGSGPLQAITLSQLPPPQFEQWNAGWNMTGIAVRVPWYTKDYVFPNRNSDVFKFVNGAYVPADDPLDSNRGYWVRFPSTQAITYTGTFIDSMAMPVEAGWNIIGSISVPVDTAAVQYSSPGMRASRFFKYQNGYVVVDRLNPGLGFWVKSSQPGFMILKSGALCPTNPQPVPQDKFIITDSDGQQQELYVASAAVSPEADRIEMPPAPPEFDARWESGDYRIVVEPSGSPIELPIAINEADFPITLDWELDPATGLEYALPDSGRLGKGYVRMSGTGQVTITAPTRRLVLVAGGAGQPLPAPLPSEFALAQNHPNPFNPRTVIDYQLPIDAHVVLKVYDLLGRVVATVVDEQKPAGYHRATFDAAAVGSGVYFYRMAAGNYTAVRKMVVVK